MLAPTSRGLCRPHPRPLVPRPRPPCSARPTLRAAARESPSSPSSSSPLPASVDLKIYRARKKSRDGDRAPSSSTRRSYYKESETLFRDVIASSPRNGRAYVGLAKVLERQNQVELARKVCEEGCTATKGENAHVWQVWGTLEAKNDVRRARQLFDAAIAADKTLISAYHSWAKLEEREGNRAKARQLLVKALAAAEHVKRPASHVYVALARLAETEKDHESARKWYKLGVASGNFRDCGPALTAWAIMEAKQGNEKVSRELFQKSLKGAKSRFAWLTLGTWEGRWGNLQSSRDILKEAMDLFPADAAIIQGYATSLTKADEKVKADMAEARTHFERAVKVNKSHQHAYHNWAMAEWLLAKDVDRARELYQQGIWAGPTTAQAAKSFSAWAHMEAMEDRNIELSRSLYACANKIKPKSTKVLLNWAQDERRVGNDARGEELEALAETISEAHRTSTMAVSPASAPSKAKLEPSKIASEIADTKSLTALSIETSSEIVRTLAESLESISYSAEASETMKTLVSEVDEFITEWSKYFDKQKRKKNERENLLGSKSLWTSPFA